MSNLRSGDWLDCLSTTWSNRSYYHLSFIFTNHANAHLPVLYYESSDNADLRTPPESGWKKVVCGIEPGKSELV